MQKENKSHHTKLAQVIALINTSALSINHTTSTSSMIIDTMFPAYKSCSDDSENTILEEDLVFLAKSVIKMVYTNSYQQ